MPITCSSNSINFIRFIGCEFPILNNLCGAAAVDEAIDYLHNEGFNIDRLRIRSFPFDKILEKFIDDHKYIFILEQNRDAQMKFLISNELKKDINSFISLLNFDGSPVTAQFIIKEFIAKIKGNKKIMSKVKKPKSAA